MLTRAWIFLHIYPIIRQLSTHLSRKNRVSTDIHLFSSFFLEFNLFFHPVQTARSHWFRPLVRLANIFQHLNLKNSGHNTLFGPLTRWCACAVVRSNFPGRFKVQTPSHQKDQVQAIRKTAQLHRSDSHKSRSDIPNIRQTRTFVNY